MTVIATASNCTYCGDGIEGGYLSEASTLGLAPGDWPKCIDTHLGNGQPFVKKKRTLAPDGEIIDVQYWQAFGSLVLHVIND